jgi:hypothetical protein
MEAERPRTSNNRSKNTSYASAYGLGEFFNAVLESKLHGSNPPNPSRSIEIEFLIENSTSILQEPEIIHQAEKARAASLRCIRTSIHAKKYAAATLLLQL